METVFILEAARPRSGKAKADTFVQATGRPPFKGVNLNQECNESPRMASKSEGREVTSALKILSNRRTRNRIFLDQEPGPNAI